MKTIVKPQTVRLLLSKKKFKKTGSFSFDDALTNLGVGILPSTIKS